MGDRAFSLPEKHEAVEITLNNAGNLNSVKGEFIMADMVGATVQGYVIETPGEFGETVTNYFNYDHVVGLSWGMQYEPTDSTDEKEAAGE